MYCILICRLARQVMGGMSAERAARVLSTRQFTVCKAYLRERGVMRGDAFVDQELDAMCWGKEREEWLEEWLKGRVWEREPNTVRAAVRMVVLAKSTRIGKEDLEWADKLFRWVEGQKRARPVLEKWMAWQKREYERLPRERRWVMGVLGGEEMLN